MMAAHGQQSVLAASLLLTLVIRAQRPASQVLCISMGCGPSIAPSCKGILDKICFVDIFRGVPHVIGNPTDTKTVMFYFGTSSGCIMYLFASICICYPAFLPGSDPTEFLSAWEEQVMRNMAGRVVF